MEEKYEDTAFTVKMRYTMAMPIQKARTDIFIIQIVILKKALLQTISELIQLMNLEILLMNSRIDYIKELQKALELFSEGARILDESILKCYDKGFQAKLNEYIMMYAKLNYDFSSYLIMKLTEAYIYDNDSAEFEAIMKQLGEDIDIWEAVCYDCEKMYRVEKGTKIWKCICGKNCKINIRKDIDGNK